MPPGPPDDRTRAEASAPDADGNGALAGDVRLDPHPRHLDQVIHERLRLAIVVALAQREGLTFAEIKATVGLTDGNLSVHARRLEEVGYIEARKHTDHRTVRTEYRLTPAGRRALARYLDTLADLRAFVRPLLPPR